ncbi:hypothetical protein K470DRAFT_273721 [Piedraia hortae CBS 480.64]|uniref:Amino acid permease/ SLC12A domain-containing protein n=1 Tax=Piedraia hortae CBS 480.64 TaxID=1314780 RepID=A0A6A7CAD3_9PEZI|nr:hypothetical protein K470DRAFT_273721 [Piedraia hortae CBS 480.64]
MLITFSFCITDIEVQVINIDSDFPVLFIIRNITKSNTATCILGTALFILYFVDTVSVVTTSSRQIWTFSRDDGMPFSSLLRRVSPSKAVPVNTLVVCIGVCPLFSTVNFGSDVAFDVLTSVFNVSPLLPILSYLISIGYIRLKRLRDQPLSPSKLVPRPPGRRPQRPIPDLAGNCSDLLLPRGPIDRRGNLVEGVL